MLTEKQSNIDNLIMPSTPSTCSDVDLKAAKVEEKHSKYYNSENLDESK